MARGRRALVIAFVSLVVACRGASPRPPADPAAAPAAAPAPATATAPVTAAATAAAAAPAAAPTTASATVFHRTPPPGVRTAAQCNANIDCGPCMHDGCGWCGAESYCTSGDSKGPWEGSCAGRWTVSADCTTSKHEWAVMEANATKRLGELIGTLTPDGARVDGRIEDRKTFSFPVRRGRCYVASFRMAQDGEPDAETGPVLQLEAPYVEGGDVEQLGGRRSALRRTCPQKDGTLKVQFANPRDLGRKAIGKGGFSIELFSGPISEKELRAQLERRKSSDDDRLARAFCAACARDFLACQLRGDPGCIMGHLACLQLNRLSIASCEAGRFERPAEPPKRKGATNPDGTTDL